MNANPAQLLISVPFGRTSESVNSTRYFWDNNHRNEEPFVILQWTMEGSGEFVLQGKTWSLSPGYAFIAIQPEASSYYFPKQAAEPWKFAWLNFYGAFGVSLMREFRKAFGPVAALPLQSVAAGMFLSLAAMGETRDFPDSYEVSSACYAFLMEWSRLLTRPAHQDRDRVDMAMTLCRSRFREPLGIKELAAETGLTREHLTRIFTARAGVSPGRYLRNLRVAAARQMLKGQAITLKETALRCGFSSVRSLNHALAEDDRGV